MHAETTVVDFFGARLMDTYTNASAAIQGSFMGNNTASKGLLMGQSTAAVSIDRYVLPPLEERMHVAFHMTLS